MLVKEDHQIVCDYEWLFLRLGVGIIMPRKLKTLLQSRRINVLCFALRLRFEKRSMIQNHEVAKKITTSKIIKTKLGNSYNQGFNF